MKKILITCVALSAFASTAAAQRTVAPADNPQMSAIYAADQGPRTGVGATVDWAVVGPQDAARRVQTRTLLNSGALRTGDDFYQAATVLQHGTEASDYMLAHTLAIIALARGRQDAAWMAAATLDRYLMVVGHSQIYGTQFNTPDRQNTTQEPYDRSLVSDSLRQALGVPTLSEQEVRREDIQTRYRNTPRP
jgi:hypothetical protein